MNVTPGFGYRALWYAAAFALGISVMLLVPAGKTVVSGIGSRTLQILVWHMPILKLMRYLGLVSFLKGIVPGHYRLVFVLLSVPFTIVLSLPALKKPFDKFWELCGR